MKSATPIIRTVLGLHGRLVYSDRRKDRPEFSKVVAIKCAFFTPTPEQIQSVIEELAKEGFTVLKHYFFTPYKVNGQENFRGVEGYRFIVGYPKEPTAKIIEHPATTAYKSEF